jgi:hypothetical protein
MHRVTRLVGTAYAGLWLIWSTWIAFEPDGMLAAALRSPSGQGQSGLEPLAWLILTPLAGLLASFWFVRRSRFCGAAITLVLTVFFTLAATIGVDAVTAPDDSCFCSPVRGRAMSIAACRLSGCSANEAASPAARAPRSRGLNPKSRERGTPANSTHLIIRDSLSVEAAVA